MRPLAMLAVLILLPSALASWQPTLTTQEPSTSFDTPDRMWQDPTSAPWESRIYLDVAFAPTPATGVMPRLEATLGVWRDCDRDGIIGRAGTDAYSAFLLLDVSVCPPGSRHNDGATVREVLWIGPGLAYPHIPDPDARVWADRMLPNEPAPPVKDAADDVFSLATGAAGPRWVGASAYASPPAEVTAYAFVSPSAIGALGLQLPSGFAMFVYGSEHCTSPFGIQSGWQCDPSQWPSAPRVGDPYQLRDVDCAGSC